MGKFWRLKCSKKVVTSHFVVKDSQNFRCRKDNKTLRSLFDFLYYIWECVSYMHFEFNSAKKHDTLGAETECWNWVFKIIFDNGDHILSDQISTTQKLQNVFAKNMLKLSFSDFFKEISQ
jgi:hypothetical protein